MESLPTWALEVMLACAKNASHDAFAVAIESALSSHLFESEEKLWYSHFPQQANVIARDLSNVEAWIPIPSQTIDAVFGASGDLAAQYEHYEPRPGQTALSHAILQSLNQQQFLLAEAGTGVGKSLAYLVPAALWACYNNLPIVISTNTRNLQSQLLVKDLPLVKRILQRHLPQGVNLRASVLKGRGNYLCLKRFGAYLEGGFEGLKESEALLFAELVQWAAQTDDGDLERFRPTYTKGDINFTSSFSCGSVECPGKKCRFYRRCFLLKARQNALLSHLVIVNHALVFSDLVNSGKLLPPYAQIVFDEAHNLENVATNCLSETLSPVTLYDICQKIAPSRGREVGSLFHHVQVDFIEKAITNPADQAQKLQLLSDIRATGVELAKVGKDLFNRLYSVMEKTPEEALRYRSVPDETLPRLPDGQPQLRREFCFSKEVFVPAEEILPAKELQSAQDRVRQTVSRATALLNQLEMMIKVASPAESLNHPYEELISALGGVREHLAEFCASMDRLLAGAEQDVVYWMEQYVERDRTVSLHAAPLDIAFQLKQLLYKDKASIVFSSATLRIRNSFDHIQRTLGLSLIEPATRVASFLAESPFDYSKQCCVAVPDYLPDITSKDHAYETELSRLMYRLFVVANGRSLALFTSYEMMQYCAQLLQPHLEKQGIDLLVQSANMSRDVMTEIFREQQRPTVIFGTQSFWEGVDVVGNALSCVVIARLPFEVVNDPLNVARSERIRKAGLSPFNELSLPQALIKFRQGFGRLIRSRSDRGMVVIADSRIVRKGYGYTFAQALPSRIETFGTRLSIERRLQRLLHT
ncbi:MAG: helicase C-terminal domain-containing protein [bacterium]|nr:helicase C-terminal domain-containing protein [bacterium]